MQHFFNAEVFTDRLKGNQTHRSWVEGLAEEDGLNGQVEACFYPMTKLQRRLLEDNRWIKKM